MSETLIEKLSKRECVTVLDKDNLKTVIDKLNEYNIGALPVLNKNNVLVGIISERDIIHLISKNSEVLILNKKVEACMTKSIISCGKNTRADELMELMTKYKIRHIPIVIKNNLVGIISIGDVVKRLLEKYKSETLMLREYISL